MDNGDLIPDQYSHFETLNEHKALGFLVRD